MKPVGKVAIVWSPSFSYAIGLLTSDGNLSPDGRHINLTSKDEEIVNNFKSCLKLNNKIGRKSRGGSLEKKYFVLQFGDKLLYNYLLGIGLSPAKSRIMGPLQIPDGFFIDFLRGCIDGDGNINIASHPESKLPQLRLRLASGSKAFLKYIKAKSNDLTKVRGGWIYEGFKANRNAPTYVLNFGKRDSIILLRAMYHSNAKYYLKRKYIIARKFLGE